MNNSHSARHLVLGSGPVGSAVTALLAEAGHEVRVVSRSGRGIDHPLVEKVAADARDAERVTALAEGAVAVYNCLNPAYDQWAQDFPPMGRAALQAAQTHGAVLAVVSNLYPYGPVAGPIHEGLPQAGQGKKAKIRAAMWEEILAAHRAGIVRVTEVRGSDYLGAHSESQLGERVIPRLLAGKSAQLLGNPDTRHSWTWTGDVARMLVIAAADERAWGKVWHVPTNEPRSAREALGDITTILGLPQPKISRLPSPVLAVAGMFSPVLREVREVVYQAESDWVIDDTAARTTFGLTPTPWQEVLRDHLSPWMSTTGAAAA